MAQKTEQEILAEAIATQITSDTESQPQSGVVVEGALEHQLKIARQTLKMSDVGASLMGGMSKSDAAKLIAKHHGKSRATKLLKQSGHNDGEIAKLFESSDATLLETAQHILNRIDALGLKRVKLPGSNTRASAKWENDEWELELGSGSVGGERKKWRVRSKKNAGSDASLHSNSFKAVEDHIKK